MKGLFITLLALPAILAAPANVDEWPTTFPIDSFICTCTDGGERNTNGPCLAMYGAQLGREAEWVRYYVLVSIFLVLCHLSFYILYDH
jgi:hypothetical protein